MENKSDLRVRRTYRLLTDAMIELMREKSFEKITVIEICEKAMVHRATFYKYFEDKYQLLEYCMNEIALAFSNDEKDFENVESYKEFFLIVSKCVLNEFYNNKDIYLAILKKNSNSYLMDKIKDTLTYKINEKFIELKNSGVQTDVPTDMMANFYAGACINTLHWCIKNEVNDSVEHIIEYIKKVLDCK